jgi:hypothetical protein
MAVNSDPSETAVSCAKRFNSLREPSLAVPEYLEVFFRLAPLP